MSQAQTVQIDPYLAQQIMPPNDFTVDPQYHNMRITTPVGRFMYINVDKPHAIKQANGTSGDPKFAATLMMAPALTADLYKCIIAVADTHWPFIDIGNPSTGQIERVPGSRLLGMDPKQGGIHYPLRSADDAYRVDPVRYADFLGLFFINCSMNPKTRTGIDQRPITLDSRGEVCDPAVFYPGCYGRMNVTVAPFEVSGNRGVTFFLNAVQFAENGKRITVGFDAVKAAQNAFGNAGALPPSTPMQPAAGFGPNSLTPGSIPPGAQPVAGVAGFAPAPAAAFTQGPAPQVVQQPVQVQPVQQPVQVQPGYIPPQQPQVWPPAGGMARPPGA